MPPGVATVSVVISTYQRADACERALRSALGQSQPPLEVLVCDDGSADDTQTRMQAWERRDERVRYLRTAANSGTPAVTRNLGIEHARGELIAFLDDDDEWLPGKLEVQLEAFVGVGADVVAANALRSNGSPYFPDARPQLRPTRAELLRANPIITSSALARRSLVRFPTARWMRGIEDYAAWLRMADRGARFLILGAPLVHYQDASPDRLSAARTRGQMATAGLAWRRAIEKPSERARTTAAMRWTAGAIYVAAEDGLAAILDVAPRSAR
jgi:teichuronic acid biosynthesis glycosyltransferase TuaG